MRAASDWVTFSTPTTGQGTAELAFSVQPNRSTSPRSIEITVGDQRVTISQEAATCPWSVSSSQIAMGPEGGEQTVSLSTDDFCSWQTAASDSWVTVGSGSNGRGNANIVLQIARNEGRERTATVTVGGATISVRQREAPPLPVPSPPTVPPPPAVPPPVVTPPPVVVPPPVVPPPVVPPPVVVPPPTPEPTPTPPPPVPVPCTFQVAPTVFNNVASSASTLQVDVTTQTGCTWSAASNDTWITIASGGNGTGNGRVELTAAQNTGTARTGTLVVAGQTITVNQQAPAPVPVACTFQVDPTAFSGVAFSETQLEVVVTTQTGCAWTAVSNASWVTISGAANGTGSGRVQLTAAANTGSARSGTLVIAGETVSISQQGAPPPPCAYTINPSSYSPSSAAGSTTVTVTTTSGCAWTVSGNPGWISATPASGTGPGTTVIAIQANTGAARSATLKIADIDFVVTQASAPCTYAAGPTTRSVPYTRSTREITVLTESHCPVSATESVSWIEIITAPTFGTVDITFRVQENTDEDPRSAPITITGENFVHTVTVTQAGND